MADLKISQLPQVEIVEDQDDIAVVQGGVTSRSTKNVFLSGSSGYTRNIDTLNLPVQKTLFVRDGEFSVLSADVLTGTPNTNLFTTDAIPYIGSTDITDEFISGATNFVAKNIEFRVVGKFGNSGTDFVSSLYIGEQLLTASTVSEITGLTKAIDHPFEISGDLLFTSGSVRVCYSLGYCNDKGEFGRYALSDATTTQDITSFSGGPLQLKIESGTTIDVYTYFANIRLNN